MPSLHGKRLVAGFLSALWLAMSPVGLVAGGTAETNRRFAVDANTGLAMGGFDPVSYFLADRPRIGKRRFELRWAGATWRFANVGNLDAFKSMPRVYAPRFGGHGALAVARGFAAQGSPMLWAVHKDRLYFFYSPVNRLGWLQAPARLVIKGEKNWTRLRAEIAGF